MKKVKIFQLKIAIFTAVKNRCILYGRVFVMVNMNAPMQMHTLINCKCIVNTNESILIFLYAAIHS